MIVTRIQVTEGTAWDCVMSDLASSTAASPPAPAWPRRPTVARALSHPRGGKASHDTKGLGQFSPCLANTSALTSRAWP